MQIICTSLHTNNHASTSLLIFYRPDALPEALPTMSEHWRQVLFTSRTRECTDSIKFVESLPMFLRHRVVDESCCVNWMLSEACPHSQLIQMLFFKVSAQRFCILHATTIISIHTASQKHRDPDTCSNKPNKSGMISIFSAQRIIIWSSLTERLDFRTENKTKVFFIVFH